VIAVHNISSIVFFFYYCALLVDYAIFLCVAKDLEKSAVNIKAVLQRLYSYARHPSSFKRLGSALGFNNIYTILR